MKWKVLISAVGIGLLILGFLLRCAALPTLKLSAEAAQPPMLTSPCVVPGTYEARTLANGWVVAFVANNGYRAEHIAPDLEGMEAEMSAMCEEAAARGK